MKGSLRAYARYRQEMGLDGGTLAGVQRAIASGRIVREQDGSIDFEKADAAWLNNTAPTVSSRTARHRAAQPNAPAVGEATRPAQNRAAVKVGGAYQQARTLREGFLAQLSELEYRRKAGDLVVLSEVEKEWSSIMSVIRNRMLLLPAKLAPRLAALTDARECHVAIDGELRAALAQLAEDSGGIAA